MVVRVIDPRMVMIADNDGFEIPVLVSELVRMDTTTAGGRFFEEQFKAPENAPIRNTEEQNEEDKQVSGLSPSVTGSRTSEEICLAYVPHDQKWLITGLMDVLLINNTSYDLLYNLYHKTALGHYEGVDYGSVFSDTKLLIATVNRENIARWSDGYLQFLFHKVQCREVLPPFNAEFRVDGKKFFKEGNYRESTLAGGKAIVIKVISLTQYLKREPEPAGERPAEAGIRKAGTPGIHMHKTAPREAEIDLHIHELVDDPVNLEKSEILEYQKNYFIKRLEEALAEDYLKLTVIHGVGNGILRNALLDLLKNYKGIEILDAPMSKYGVGAIEIRIPHNRT